MHFPTQTIQVAQLSQRDRAAWWVSNGQKWKTGTERNIYGQYRSTLGCTVEALRAIIGSKSATSLQRGPVNPKFQVEGVAPTNHSPSQKTRINVLSYDIKNLITAFFRFVTMHAFDRLADRQTDRILIVRPRLHSMQCSAVKMSGFAAYSTSRCVPTEPSPCYGLGMLHCRISGPGNGVPTHFNHCR